MNELKRKRNWWKKGGAAIKAFLVFLENAEKEKEETLRGCYTHYYTVHYTLLNYTTTHTIFNSKGHSYFLFLKIQFNFLSLKSWYRVVQPPSPGVCPPFFSLRLKWTSPVSDRRWIAGTWLKWHKQPYYYYYYSLCLFFFGFFFLFHHLCFSLNSLNFFPISLSFLILFFSIVGSHTHTLQGVLKVKLWYPIGIWGS